jgi:hypothetical protein
VTAWRWRRWTTHASSWGRGSLLRLRDQRRAARKLRRLRLCRRGTASGEAATADGVDGEGEEGEADDDDDGGDHVVEEGPLAFVGAPRGSGRGRRRAQGRRRGGGHIVVAAVAFVAVVCGSPGASRLGAL